MKRASLILFLFLILMEVKMPVNQILKEEQGNKQTYKPAAFKPGAVQSGVTGPKVPEWYAKR